MFETGVTVIADDEQRVQMTSELCMCVFVHSYGLKPVFIHYLLLIIQQIVAKVLIKQLTWHSP